MCVCCLQVVVCQIKYPINEKYAAGLMIIFSRATCTCMCVHQVHDIFSQSGADYFSDPLVLHREHQAESTVT